MKMKTVIVEYRHMAAIIERNAKIFGFSSDAVTTVKFALVCASEACSREGVRQSVIEKVIAEATLFSSYQEIVNAKIEAKSSHWSVEEFLCSEFIQKMGNLENEKRESEDEMASAREQDDDGDQG